VQLEVSQRIYMDEASAAYDEVRAAQATGVIDALLRACLADDR
jgi:N-formylglutamate deformylase